MTTVATITKGMRVYGWDPELSGTVVELSDEKPFGFVDLLDDCDDGYARVDWDDDDWTWEPVSHLAPAGG